MIKIRPGRSWRQNPTYLAELRGLRGREARAFAGAGIRDVIGLEVDGVDLTAGLGEGPVLEELDELLRALLQLFRGAPAAQAALAPGPTEALFEARGSEVLLSLVALGPRSKLLASGLLLDANRLREATLAAADRVLSDLLEVSPELAGAAVARRLSAARRALGRSPHRLCRVPYGSTVSREVGFVIHGGRAPPSGVIRCEVRVSQATAARLACARLAPQAPLAALLGQAGFWFRFPAGPSIAWEAPGWVCLRDLVRQAAGLLQAWEDRESAAVLELPEGALRLDLQRDLVSYPGLRSELPCSAAQLSTALAGAAKAFAERGLRLLSSAEPRTPELARERLGDLRTSAEALAARARDLSSGRLLRGTRLAGRPAPVASDPIGLSRLRKLVYQESWVRPVAQPAKLLGFGDRDRPVVVSTEGDHLLALDAHSGSVHWQLRMASAACRLAHDATELLAAEPDGALRRLDPATGAVRWRRKFGSPAQTLHLLGSLSLRGDAEATVGVAADGSIAFRSKGPPIWDCVRAGPVVVLLRPGQLCALDPLTGQVLWSADTPQAAPVRVFAQGNLLALATHARLTLRSALDGGVLLDLPCAGLDQPVLRGDHLFFLQDDELRGFDLQAQRLAFRLRVDEHHSQLLAEEDAAHGHVVALLANVDGLQLIEESGRTRWRRSHPDLDSSAPVISLSRGILFLRTRIGTEAISLREGLNLVTLPHRAESALLLADWTLALQTTGELRGYRLTTHLSLAGS